MESSREEVKEKGGRGKKAKKSAYRWRCRQVGRHGREKREEGERGGKGRGSEEKRKLDVPPSKASGSVRL